MADESDKMMRALAGQLGTQLLDYFRKHSIADYKNDKTIITIRDWKTEGLFRRMVIYRPEFLEKPAFLDKWYLFREKQLTQYLEINKDSLSAIALLFDNESDSKVDMNIVSFIYTMQNKGPDNQGDVIEILGPMRSGKTNFMVWMMLIAQSHGIHIITNIPLYTAKERIHEVHKLSEVMIEMAKIRKDDRDAITWIILDEQGGLKGSGSRTATTRETRWNEGFIRIIGKFGGSLWRARQWDDIVKEQKGLVSIQFKKSTDKLDSVTGEFKTGLYAGTEIRFNKIANESDKYDTRSMSSFSMDLDMEVFNARYANLEGDISKEETTQEDIVIEVVNKMLTSTKTKTHEKVCELAAKGMEPKDIAEITGYSLKQVYNILEAEFY